MTQTVSKIPSVKIQACTEFEAELNFIYANDIHTHHGCYRLRNGQQKTYFTVGQEILFSGGESGRFEENSGKSEII